MSNLVGSRIKYYRLQAHISQKELADALGYKHHSSVARIEDGSHDVPLSVLEAIAKIFNVSPCAFFNPIPQEVEEFYPYLMNAAEWQLKAVREILHMPEEKREQSSSSTKEVG